MSTPPPTLRLARRRRRIASRVRGSSDRPRLCVHRSLRILSVQVVDDEAGRTLTQATSREAKAKPTVEGARKLGSLIAKKAKEAGVTKVVFDRNVYKYHGRIAALAKAAREGGLQF